MLKSSGQNKDFCGMSMSCPPPGGGANEEIWIDEAEGGVAVDYLPTTHAHS